MPPGSPASHWRFLVDENLPERLTSQLRAEGYAAEHVYDVGLRTRPDSEVYVYALSVGAILITQDHDVQRDASQFTAVHPGVVLVELPQNWPRDDKLRRILNALRSLAGRSLENTLVIVEPSQILVR